MPKRSAGVLLYERAPGGGVRVLLVHPGGPFWRNRDEHAWSIPKGEYDDEAAWVAARREFAEELGSPPPDGEPMDLGEVRQSSGKYVRAFAVRGDFDPDTLDSSHFEVEWPPRSGRQASFPEVDRAAWFDVDTARTKLHKGQVTLLDLLLERIEATDGV